MGSPPFKKLLGFSALALVLSGCSSGDCTGPLCAGPQDPVVTGTISGRVTVDGVGEPGVTVTVSSVGSQATSSTGDYSFSNVPAGTYQVSMSGISLGTSCPTTSGTATISESSRSVTVNFACEADRTASISGRVSAGGAGLSGITVSLDGKANGATATSTSGQYSFTSLTAGSYNVSISGYDASRYAFSATSQARTLSVGEAATVHFVGTVLSPDLVITSVTAPATGTIGDSTGVSITIANVGGGDAGAFRLGIYFSTDSTITTGDVIAASCAMPALPAGGEDTCSGTITIPASLAPGTWYLGAIADDESAVAESDESNNTGYSSAITLSRAVPDLEIISVTAPSIGTIGDTMSVNISLRNSGGGAAGPFRVGLYFSANTLITVSDQLAGSCASKGLAAGAPETCSGTLTIPSSLSPGTWYLGAIVDDEGAVTESDESNNRGHSSAITLLVPGTDLVIESFTVPATGRHDQPISLSITVKNQGTVGSGSYRLAIYFSLNSTITAGEPDLLLNACTMSPLAPGASEVCSGTVTITSAIPPRSYFMGAYADDQFVVTESNESNNTASSLIVISN